MGFTLIFDHDQREGTLTEYVVSPTVDIFGSCRTRLQ